LRVIHGEAAQSYSSSRIKHFDYTCHLRQRCVFVRFCAFYTYLLYFITFYFILFYLISFHSISFYFISFLFTSFHYIVLAFSVVLTSSTLSPPCECGRSCQYMNNSLWSCFLKLFQRTGKNHTSIIRTTFEEYSGRFDISTSFFDKFLLIISNQQVLV